MNKYLFSNNWQFELVENQIVCLPQNPVHWDDLLNDWIAFLQSLNIAITATESGADRDQIWFEFNQEQYVLLIENLCESVWIENIAATNKSLEQLFFLFKT